MSIEFLGQVAIALSVIVGVILVVVIGMAAVFNWIMDKTPWR